MFNAFMMGAVGFITGYVYHDAYTIITIVCLFGFDLITGIYASFIKKSEDEELPQDFKTFILAIRSRKLLRSFISMTLHLGLLSLAWHISKTHEFYSWLPGLLVGAVCGTQFISVMENLYKGKVVTAAFVDILISKIDLKELLKKKKEK